MEIYLKSKKVCINYWSDIMVCNTNSNIRRIKIKLNMIRYYKKEARRRWLELDVKENVLKHKLNQLQANGDYI